MGCGHGPYSPPESRNQKDKPKKLKLGLKYMYYYVHCTFVGMCISDFKIFFKDAAVTQQLTKSIDFCQNYVCVCHLGSISETPDSGSRSGIRILIDFWVKSWIRIRITDKIQKLSRLRNGTGDAQKWSRKCSKWRPGVEGVGQWSQILNTLVRSRIRIRIQHLTAIRIRIRKLI